MSKHRRQLTLPTSTWLGITEVGFERLAQDKKWGQQNHRDGTGYPYTHDLANYYRQACSDNFAANAGTWRDILLEEVFEALAESDPDKLSAELNQIAAVAVAWREAIYRRNYGGQ